MPSCRIWHTIFAYMVVLVNTVTLGLLQQTCRQHFVIFNECKMLQPDFFVACLLGCMLHLSWSSFTGCQCQAEYSSNYARWRMMSKTASPRNTSQNSVSTAMTVNWNQARMATLQSVEPGCAWRKMPSRSPGLECGMHYLPTLNSHLCILVSARNSRLTFLGSGYKFYLIFY